MALKNVTPRPSIVLHEERPSSRLEAMAQTPEEKNVSGPGRTVVRLFPREVDEFQEMGLTVLPNRPDQVQVASQPRAPTDWERAIWQERRIDPRNEAVAIHGAVPLHEQGILGASSRLAPIMVVLDTGVQALPLWGSRGVAQYDIRLDREVWFRDDNGHGTRMAALISAMMPKAQFYSIAAIGRSGQGTYAELMRGLEMVARYYDAACVGTGRTMVVNASFGSSPDFATDAAIHRLLDRITATRPGLTFVFAVGNSGKANDVHSPANWISEQAIPVTALDTKDTLTFEDDQVSPTASRGGDDVGRNQHALRVGGVAADGVNVPTIDNSGRVVLDSGTSPAGALVAGAAGLVLDLHAKLYLEGKTKVHPQNLRIKQVIRDLAVDSPQVGPDVRGAGTLNLRGLEDYLLKHHQAY